MMNYSPPTPEERISKLLSILRHTPPSLEEVREAQKKSYRVFTDRDKNVVDYIWDAAHCLQSLCEAFYGSSRSSDDWWASGEYKEWREESLQGATLIPVPKAYGAEDAAKLLSYSSLYSGYGVLVLPFDIEASYISYSGGDYPLMRVTTDSVSREFFSIDAIKILWNADS
jgi:hypothetical protein